jgi:hypothetical protein
VRVHIAFHSRSPDCAKAFTETLGGVSMLYAYILISLAMLITGVALLVQIFVKVKEPLMQMFLGVLGFGLIVCAVGVFLAGLY